MGDPNKRIEELRSRPTLELALRVPGPFDQPGGNGITIHAVLDRCDLAANRATVASAIAEMVASLERSRLVDIEAKARSEKTDLRPNREPPPYPEG